MQWEGAWRLTDLDFEETPLEDGEEAGVVELEVAGGGVADVDAVAEPVRLHARCRVHRVPCNFLICLLCCLQ